MTLRRVSLVLISVLLISALAYLEALYFVNFTIRYIALWAFHVLFIIAVVISTFSNLNNSHTLRKKQARIQRNIRERSNAGRGESTEPT